MRQPHAPCQMACALRAPPNPTRGGEATTQPGVLVRGDERLSPLSAAPLSVAPLSAAPLELRTRALERLCRSPMAGAAKKKRRISFVTHTRMHDDPRWMSYAAAHAWEAEAARLGVSEVARSRRGFLRAYERHGAATRHARMRCHHSNRNSSRSPTAWTWGQERARFVARHMAQYRQHPTYRRWLALVMWAYKPPGPRPRHPSPS